MINSIIGTIAIGGATVYLADDYTLWDDMGRPVGRGEPRTAPTGDIISLDLYAPDGGYFGKLGTNGVLTFANNSTENVTFGNSPSNANDLVQTINASGGGAVPSPQPTTPTQPSPSTDFSTNTISGTLTVGDDTYQVMDDGSGQLRLWENNREIGYAVPGQNGSWNIYFSNGTPASTIYPNGTVVMADGTPATGKANYVSTTTFPTETPTQTDATITFHDPATGNPVTYTLRDGGIYGGPGGTDYIGTYQTTGPNEYSLFGEDGTTPIGVYNSAAGTLAGADGKTYSAHFTPPSGNALPDVSQVQGPWSKSESESTSYSGLGPQYQADIDQWMSDLSASMTPEAFQELISGAYSKAAGQTSEAYQAAQSYLPEIYRQQLEPSLQSGINTLAKKNMISSTVGEGTLAGAANLAYQSVLPHQAQLAGQQAGALSQLAGQEAQYQTSYPATLGGMIGNLGKYSAGRTISRSESQDPLAPYRMVYGTLPYMAQGGTG